MAKGTGTYDDPIICDGIFSKTIDGVKKFFKLNGNSSGSADHATTSRGQIAWFAQPEAPNGYLVCNGATVSRETYADLFAVIGTTFGEGDGSTTFALPNLIDKFAQGSTTVGRVKSAGLPNITGHFAFGNPDAWLSVSAASGVFTSDGGSTTQANQDGSGYSDKIQVRFNAKQYNPIYGNSETVQPPALTLLPCIRY